MWRFKPMIKGMIAGLFLFMLIMVFVLNQLAADQGNDIHTLQQQHTAFCNYISPSVMYTSELTQMGC